MGKVGFMLIFDIWWHQILLSICQFFPLRPTNINFDKVIWYELLKCRWSSTIFIWNLIFVKFLKVIVWVFGYFGTTCLATYG